jgi:tryptophan halogenase
MKIVIVGGGTSGWLTAFLLSKKQPYQDISIIDSSKLPIVGVGEGVTGTLSDLFLDPSLELDEMDFLVKTWALPKIGILFKNWSGDNSSFFSPLEGSTTANKNLDASLFYHLLNDLNLSKSGISGHYFENNVVPYYIENNTLKWDYYKSYHIDAYKFVEYFKSKTKIKIFDEVVKNIEVKNNKIEKLILSNEEIVTADVFIDCTGFQKLLISKLNSNWVSFEESLPVNEAIIFKTKENSDDRFSCTISTALKNGWVFEIPTRHKIGRGYIYNNVFTNENGALEELKEYYNDPNIEVIKKINFSSGAYEDTWVSNCISLGLSSSFLEPLQATSLHTLLTSLKKLITNCLMPTVKETFIPVSIEKYNKEIFKLNNDLKDFVQMTYLGNRKDSAFWNYVNYCSYKSERLLNIIDLAKSRLTRYSDFEIYSGCADQSLWNYTLAGLGYFDKKIIERVLIHNQFDFQELDEIRFKQNYDFKKNMQLKNYLTATNLNNYLINL